MKRLLLFAFAVVLFTSGFAAGPLAPLRIGANGRWFVDAQDRPVFILADTAWALVTQLKREEITAYLEKRREQGFNAVAAVLFVTGNSDISRSPTNAYGDAPFALADGRPDPLQPLLTPGADPSKPDEYDYWDHVDFAVAELKRLGFYGFLLPCWGNEVASVFNPDAPNPREAAPRALSVPETARAYGRWLAARYADQTHLAWMLGGDRPAVDAKTGADFRPAFRAMAEGVLAGAPRALLSYHSFKAGLQSGDWFHEEPWLAFNSIQLWPENQVRVMRRDWSALPVKPTWIFEGRYEGYWKNNYKPADWGEWQMRQQAWQAVFAGAFGHTYGHELVFGFGVTGADWRANLDTPGARSMTHLAAFMRALDPAVAYERIPDQALLAGPEGKADRLVSDLIVASRTPDGRFAMAYTAGGRSIRVKLAALAPRAFSAAWFDPRTGLWRAGGAETPRMKPFVRDLAAGPDAPEYEFDPPGEPGAGQDWVLVLTAD